MMGLVGNPHMRFTHRASTVGDHLALCQEWSMRTGDYDDLALVEGPDGAVAFAALVARHGDDVDAAVRAVRGCWWMSRDERLARPDDLQGEQRPCPECEETAHA